ncbi:MAG: hypothetical protein KDD62_01310 [Bdellovibrionales bacterium]|nr:hypothetical protein [Bdellovibrionales bacterium]
MTIKVVRGLIGQSKASLQSASNISRQSLQSAPQVVRTGQALRSDAVTSSVRSSKGNPEISKLRDEREAEFLADHVAQEIAGGPRAATTAHQLRPRSGDSTI